MAPDLGTSRRGGKVYPTSHKKPQLEAFQRAIFENCQEAYPDWEMIPADTPLWLRFGFWRQLESYTIEGGKTRHRNRADATNMQKACEDALQKWLFANDRDVLMPGSFIVAQGPDVEPAIVITGGIITADMMANYTTMAEGERARLQAALRPARPGNVTMVVQ